MKRQNLSQCRGPGVFHTKVFLLMTKHSRMDPVKFVEDSL